MVFSEEVPSESCSQRHVKKNYSILKIDFNHTTYYCIQKLKRQSCMFHHMALFITKGMLFISRVQLYPSWFFCTSDAFWLFQHIDNANYLTLSWCKNWIKWDCSQKQDTTVPLLNLQTCFEFQENCNILYWDFQPMHPN